MNDYQKNRTLIYTRNKDHDSSLKQKCKSKKNIRGKPWKTYTYTYTNYWNSMEFHFWRREFLIHINSPPTPHSWVIFPNCFLAMPSAASQILPGFLQKNKTISLKQTLHQISKKKLDCTRHSKCHWLIQNLLNDFKRVFFSLHNSSNAVTQFVLALSL